MYRQCLLKKNNTYRVGWIPTERAILNKYLKIKLDNIWVDGWKVIQIGILHDDIEIESHEMDYKKQREASDI